MRGGEGGVQADAGHGHAEAVRADQPHAVPTAHRQQVRAAGGVEPGRDHHQGPHAALAALLRDVQDRRGRDRDHGQVGGLGQVEDRGQAVLAADLPGAGVDHVEPAGVPGGADVVQDRPAHRASLPAGADHYDRFGGEHVPQAGGVRAAFPLGHGVQVAVQGRPVALTGQGKCHLHHPVLGVTLDRQAGGGEYLEHRGVLRQGLRGERGDLATASERDQVLEQQCGDAPVVHAVRHRERDLGLVPGSGGPAQRVIAGAAHDLARGQRQQRHPIRPGRPADPLGLGLGRQPAEVEEPHVGVVRGHRLVHGLDRVEVGRLGRANLDRGPVRQQRVHAAGRLRGIHASLPLAGCGLRTAGRRTTPRRAGRRACRGRPRRPERAGSSPRCGGRGPPSPGLR